jgi:hypothetical protein
MCGALGLAWFTLNSAAAGGGGGHAWSQADTPAKVMSVCVSALHSKGFEVLESMQSGSV